MFRIWRAFRKDDSGATAVDYCIITAVLSVVAIAMLIENLAK